MPKPPTSVRSIRLPDDVWVALGEEAERREVSINALVARAAMKEVAMLSDEEAAAMRARPRKPLVINRIPPGPQGAPVLAEIAKSFAAVSYGPIKAKPGSRQKASKPSKR